MARILAQPMVMRAGGSSCSRWDRGFLLHWEGNDNSRRPANERYASGRAYQLSVPVDDRVGCLRILALASGMRLPDSTFHLWGETSVARKCILPCPITSGRFER